MAENRKQPAQAPAPASPPKRVGIVRLLLIFFVLAIILAVALGPGAIALISFGMAPTIALALFDPRPQKARRGLILGAFNMAGVLLFLGELLARGGQLRVVTEILSEPLNWMAMFGAAALGALILAVSPHIAAAALQAVNKEKLKSVERKQKRLRDAWGNEVGQGFLDRDEK